jgi:hypothetical protein
MVSSCLNYSIKHDQAEEGLEAIWMADTPSLVIYVRSIFTGDALARLDCLRINACPPFRRV